MAMLPGEAGILDDEERRDRLKERKFITGGWSSAEEEEGASGDEDGPKEKNEGQAETEEAKAEQSSAIQKTSSENLQGFEDGAAIATFVRIRLQGIPAACVAEIRRERALLIGGLLPGETRMGMVQMRVKRHRWHPKLLKSGDALLLSIGWRRYQTVPTFSLEDRGEKRMRMLKYTLEHAHCMMTCYGPLVPPNTGVLAFRSFQKVTHFRVSATGGVLESAPDFEIKKKLKLVGEPYKIFKNTAFVKGMFTSDLEVSKYLHAKIQTVSGIRGEVKKPEGTRGHFRATFEDRILMSDLVVCKCWINVEPKKFYHPVVDVAGWRPARLIGELRANAGVPTPDNKDSHYGAQNVRPERKFNPLRVPKSLQKALPFKSAPKLDGKKKKNMLRKKTAVVSSEREKQINNLLSRLHAVRKEKQRIRQASNAKRKATKEVQDKFIQDKRDLVKKEARKKRYIKEGQTESKRRQAMRLE
jgi:ribosome biogenesis protein BMS1